MTMNAAELEARVRAVGTDDTEYRLGREVRGEKMWNTLSRWMEAAVLVEPTEGDE